MSSCSPYQTNSGRGAIWEQTWCQSNGMLLHLGQVRAELRDQGRQMRPAVWLRIAAKRREAAAGNRERNPRLKGRGEQRGVRSVRVTDAADLKRIDLGQRLQVVNHPRDVPNHLAHERPIRVLSVESDAVMVRLRSGRNPFTEADHVGRDADVAATDELLGERQVITPLHAAGLFLALRDRLMQANHRRRGRLGERLGRAGR